METIPILTSAGIFSILTLFYGLVKYFIGSSSFPNNNNISNGIYGFYVVIAIFIQLTININNSKALCDGKSPQIIGTMIHTFLPNLLIFIVVGICIRMFPGWLQPFSNTVGYCFLAIFKKLDWLSDLPTQGNDSALIKKDNSLFLNELTPTNFTSIITKMVKANLINFDETLEEIGSDLITKPNDGYKEMVGGRLKRKQKGGGDLSEEDTRSLPSTKGDISPINTTKQPVDGRTPSMANKQSHEVLPITKEKIVYNRKRKIAGSKEINEEKLSKEIEENLNKIKFQKLWQLVNIKSVISEVIWFLLCGVLVLAYSYNAILNLECSHSLEQQNIMMKEGDEKLEKMMKDIDES